MIVTIDGPAGAGKSSVARTLAKRLGFDFLDTGAMYRALALAGMRRHIPPDDSIQSAQLAREIEIRFSQDRVLLDNEDVTEEIRIPSVSQATSIVAALPEVRTLMVQQQQRIAREGNYVTEGRDQGTVAFPGAECKIFLTATPRERARRRALELQHHGEQVTIEQILLEQTERDRRDASRAAGPLSKADDAVEVLTDGMTEVEVVEQLLKLVDDKRSSSP